MAGFEGESNCRSALPSIAVFDDGILKSPPESRFTGIVPLHASRNRTVFAATDAALGNQLVAVKCRSCVTDVGSRLLQHVTVLRQLVHKNVITVHDCFSAVDNSNDSSPAHQNIYVVQELMDLDLHSLIVSGQVTVSHCRLFAYQLLSGLEFAHAAGIVHFHLRPSNVLVSCSDLTVKIADFGFNHIVNDAGLESSVRQSTSAPSGDAHFYRAPELLMSSDSLTSAIDIWAAGCIIVEMLIGQPPFKGTNELDQLLKIVDAVHLSDDDWTQVLRVMPNKLLKNHPFRPRVPLRTQLAGVDRQVVHLLETLLMFNGAERLTAAEAKSHVYLAEVRRLDDQQRTCEQGGPGNILSDAAGSGLSRSSEDIVREISMDSLCLSPPDDRPSFHRSAASRRSDEVALKNYRNYQTRVASPTVATGNAGERTPSPNILDFLDARSHRVIKQRRELSESDGEKEVAEISDEKLHEDLEVGNVSVELLRRLCDEVITGQVVLPVAGHNSSVVVPIHVASADSPSLGPTLLAPVSEPLLIIQPPFENFFEPQTIEYDIREFSPFNNLVVAEMRPVAAAAATENLSSCDKPFSDDDSDGKSRSGENEALQLPDDRNNEDSNKRSGEGDEFSEKWRKSGCDRSTTEQSERVENGVGVRNAPTLSRKLILDKIETEKRSQHGRHRRTGSGATQITSEEFDELYRLPTEHLRKDRNTAGGQPAERSRQSTVGSHRNHHRHHSHDSFHAAGGRHAFTDDDRAYRDVEGACGGSDYYDDLAMPHGSPTTEIIDLDLSPPTPLFVRPVAASEVPSLDDWIVTADATSLSRRGRCSLGRDASSSPESPASPHSAGATHVGARPKKSPKKHRAL